MSELAIRHSPSAIRLAILGYGYWGPNLVRNWCHILGPEAVICCDINPARRAEAQTHHPGICVTDDHEQVLDDSGIRAVTICTPASTHYALARLCLEHGKHVLVEKPLATTTGEALQLVRLARRADRTLMVGHIFLFSSPVEKLREIVQGGELGDIHYIYSIRASLGPRLRDDVNVVWDYLIHDAYILSYVLGSRPTRVRASGGAFLREGAADVVFATLMFEGDIVANCTASWYDPVKTRRMVIVGSRRMLIYDEDEPSNKITVFNRGYAPHQGYDQFGNKNWRLYDDGFYHPPLSQTEPLRLECEHFLNCILDGDTPRSDGQAGLEVVRILEAVDRSLMNSGVTIELASK